MARRRSRRDHSRAGEWNAGLQSLKRGVDIAGQLEREFRGIERRVRKATGEIKSLLAEAERDAAKAEKLAAGQVASTVSPDPSLQPIGRAGGAAGAFAKWRTFGNLAAGARAGLALTDAIEQGKGVDALGPIAINLLLPALAKALLGPAGGLVAPIAEVIQRKMAADLEERLETLRSDLHERIEALFDSADIVGRFENDARFRQAVISAGYARLSAEAAAGKASLRGDFGGVGVE